jgi:hypothetical protein
MDLRRLRVGEWIVGACGLLLLVSLFLPWYGQGPVGAYFDKGPAAEVGWTAYAPLPAVSASGWEAFTVLDVILALLALAALSVPLVTAAQRVPAVPLALQSLTALFGIGVLVLLLFRVLNLPDDLHGREWGLWVALASVLGIVAGALLAMRDERRSPEGRHTDLTGLPLSSPREIETLPAPRPEAGP